tara:strand:+ start:186 stop:668 length:483 start_codon:yes stop_codon:yes gene_type:complete
MQMSESLWVGVAFVLFFVLVWRKGSHFLIEMLDNRKKLIEEELYNAQQLRKEAQEELNKSITRQKEMIKEIEDMIIEAKDVSKKMKIDAEKKSLQIVKRRELQAKQKIDTAQNDAINEIKQIGSKIAILSSQEYIEKKIDKKTKIQFFDKTMDEINSKLN